MIMFAYLILKSYNHTVQGPDRVLCLISYTSYSRYIVHIQEWYESYGRAGLYLGPWKPTGFKAISKRGPCHLGFSCDVFLHVFCCRDKDTFGISQVNQYCIWTSSSLREDMSSKESLDSWKWAGRTLNVKSKSPNNKPKPPKIMHLPIFPSKGRWSSWVIFFTSSGFKQWWESIIQMTKGSKPDS